MASHNSCISFSYTTIYLNPVVKKEIKKKVKSKSYAFYSYCCRGNKPLPAIGNIFYNL